MASGDNDMKYLQQAAAMNYMKEMSDWFKTRMENGLDAAEALENRFLSTVGLTTTDISKQIQSIALSKDGSELLTANYAALLYILAFDEPLPKAIKSVQKNLLPSYLFGYQEDQYKTAIMFLNNMNTIAQLNSKLDMLSLESDEYMGQMKRLKSQMKDLKEDDDD